MPRRKRKTIQIGEDLWEQVRQTAQATGLKITTQVEMFLRGGLAKSEEGAGGLAWIKRWIDKLNVHELTDLLVHIGNLIKNKVEVNAAQVTPELNKEVLIRFLRENWSAINTDSSLEPTAENNRQIEQLAQLVIEQGQELQESAQIKDQFVRHLISGNINLADVCLLGEELDLSEKEVEQLWNNLQILMALRKQGIQNGI